MITRSEFYSTFGDRTEVSITAQISHLTLSIMDRGQPIACRVTMPLTPDEARKLAAALVRHADGIAPETEGTGNG